MPQILQHAMFLVAVGATAAAMRYAGPESALAIGTAFGGLLLVHLAGILARGRGASADAGAARASSELPASARRSETRSGAASGRVGGRRAAARGSDRRSEVTSAEKASSVEPSTSETGTPESPASGPTGREGTIEPSGGQEPPARPETSEPSGGARRTPDPRPARERRHGAAEGAKASRASTGEPDRRTEREWLDGQLANDVEEVSFLPPYASGEEAEAGPAEDEDDLESWAPPEILEAVQAAPGEEAAEAVEAYRNVPIPRHFALGTVAIIRDLMEPVDVAEVLLEQRRQPKRKFGETAVAMGFLTADQLEELLLAQQEGLFTDEEIQEARRRLRAYRHSGVASGG